MPEQRVELFPIASASNLGEAIRIQMLLDRARLPYRIHGDKLFGLYGDAALSLAGPIQFLIPLHLKEQAEECLIEIFDVQLGSLPANCPACDAQVGRGLVDCPSCGLFLG